MSKPGEMVLGDLRSLLRVNVKVMALTATATTETFHVVTQRLSMKSPILIASPPSRDNIMYRVKPSITKEALASLLSDEMKETRASFAKTILYVRALSDCSDLYKLIKFRMGKSFTEPPGYPDHHKFRMVEMYSAVATTDKKEQIFTSFKDLNSNIRLIIATTAFGMGIDISDIGSIVHWGIPSSLEEYVQETGRAGRDGSQAVATLYAGKSGKNTAKKMLEYTTNISCCRRKYIFENFIKYHEKDTKVTGCRCCDVCSQKCDCCVCVGSQ